MKKIIPVLAAGALAAGLLAGTAASAQTTLKMAHSYTPGNIWYEAGEAYKKAIEERTGGKVKVAIDHSRTCPRLRRVEGGLVGSQRAT